LTLATTTGAQQTVRFIASLCVPLALLLAFKYYSFFALATSQISGKLGASIPLPAFSLAAPVGISFFVFKTLSYLIDVRMDKIVADKNILNIANYIAFFPQILAGPIERAGNFLPQLAMRHNPDFRRFRDGMALILWGLFKKAVVADNCAAVVNLVYAAPAEYPGLALIIATYCYAVQIYCDFSGYSDMAIGIAKILGFSTMQNFNRPYGAVSVGDFWRRWHISLSTWFRDYIYIPLGGNRVPLRCWVLNIMAVFLISGLWHGANWTFIAWGALHGFFLAAERTLSSPLSRFSRLIGVTNFPRLIKSARAFLTFHLITFAWIFFRARSIDDACYIAGHLFDGMSLTALNLFQQRDLVVAALCVAGLAGARLVAGGESKLSWLMRRPLWLRWTLYAALALAVINIRPLIQSGFIYLQF
jgi:D-alanyl-lipoteichoic acid acyltransferase DltB (MBOAT superfamily)